VKLSRVKLGLFYVSTVIAVVILFGAVTSFGESIIVANSIEGVYTLQDWQATGPLPSCLGQTRSPWLLVLHQSGIFVNASLVKPTPEINEPEQKIAAALREPTTLIGRFENSAIALQGPLPSLAVCETQATSMNQTDATLQATLDQRNLVGTLEIGTGEIGFRGVWQDSPLSSTTPAGH
jgi:hypothetical protein